jgi:hypothetical protein
MIITTESLLDTTVYGTPSGNYDGSSLDFFGDPAKAANYYRGLGSLQTINIRVTDFVGTIKLQATLHDDPTVSAWVNTYTYDGTGGPISEYLPVNITGNFTFMRVEAIGFEAGTINSITIAY